MDHNRAQTLQALEAFIQSQRDLLARQRSDIEQLNSLKVDLIERPAYILTNLGNELDNPAFRLSEQGDCRLKLPKGIDWTVFEKGDTTQLRALAFQTRETHLHRTRVGLGLSANTSATHLSPTSELSDLQKLVKRARTTIVDPILAQISPNPSPDSDSDSDSEMQEDPIERRRRLEREKIAELKKRKIRGGGLSLPASSLAGVLGVFVRNDVDDETGEVDIDVDLDSREGEQGGMEVDRPPPTPQGKTAWSNGRPPSLHQQPLGGSRSRKPTTKAKATSPLIEPEPVKKLKIKSTNPTKTKPKPKAKHTFKPPETSSDIPETERALSSSSSDEESVSDRKHAQPHTKPPRKKEKDAAKPKPETYKQAWSMSEQNLLEQLLEEIGEGEKNRWQKISRAMGGRRTPRQVASRVQKYFEKLKKFGVVLGDGGGT